MLMTLAFAALLEAVYLLMLMMLALAFCLLQSLPADA